MRLLLLQKLPRLKYIIKKSYFTYFNISKRAELMRRETRIESYPCCLVDRCTQTDEGMKVTLAAGKLVASPGRLSPTKQI
jgi:rRNA maturation protein Rpf1